jgi:hypothetical protein
MQCPWFVLRASHAQIKYGVCGVGAVGFTFGLAFTLNSPATITLRVAPDPDQAGCFVYRVRAVVMLLNAAWATHQLHNAWCIVCMS